MESGALDGSRARAPGKVRRGGELRAPQSSEQMDKVGRDASEREGEGAPHCWGEPAVVSQP